MTFERFRNFLKDPSGYAREIYTTMAQLRYTDSNGSDKWDSWMELPSEERDSFIDAICMTVIDPAKQIVKEKEDEIILLKAYIDELKKTKSGTGGSKLCYYCGKKYAIDQHACGDCLNGRC